jgi:hypothetical protein
MHNRLSGRLAAEFTDQGEFYKEIFGVDRIDAEVAGWHPEHSSFDSGCGGWKQFLSNKGRISKQEMTDHVSWRDLLFSEND